MNTYKVIRSDEATKEVATKEQAIIYATNDLALTGLGSEIWIIEDNTETLVTWVPFTTATA